MVLATDIGLTRRVDLRVHQSGVVPMTCGYVRPVIYLPTDALAWPDADIQRAVLHELEHVRRGDWLLHLVARATCAFYWFHPLAWVAWRMLGLACERACDDAVLRSADRATYAELLLRLARRMLREVPPALSMTTRSDLSARVSAILDSRQRRGPVGRLLVSAAAAGAVVLVLAVAPLRAVAGRIDVPSSRAFDAAAVTRNVSTTVLFPNNPHARISTQAGGLCSPWGWIRPTETCFRATNVTLHELVNVAYAPTGIFAGVPDPPILDAPTWADTDRFDVVARASGNGEFEPFRGQPLSVLQRTLLTDMFKLTLHTESRSLPTFDLVQGNQPPVRPLRPASEQCAAAVMSLRVGRGLVPRSLKNCFDEQGPDYLRAAAIDMFQLSRVLSRVTHRVVRDRTGLSGLFALDLTWRGVPIASALAQLGLTLEPTDGPVDVLVIDRASEPSPK